MSLTLRTASSQDDHELAGLIDACFERAAHESRLAQVLAQGCPTYDPGLALLAEREGKPVGWALFLPRRIRIRGAWLSLCVSAPFGVLPEARGLGVGRFLMQAGTQALRDRGIHGALVIGSPGFFEHFGYYPGFDLYSTVVGREELAQVEDVEGWRGLVADDIPALDELYRANHAECDGVEERTHAAVDWESSAPAAFSLVHERDGRVDAYLRFRVRAELLVRECAARDEGGVRALLGFLRRLLDEHSRTTLEVHAPPTHPLARALHHRGATAEANNFQGSALLALHDWPSVLRASAPAWERALDRAHGNAIGLDLGAERLQLSLGDDGLVVAALDEGAAAEGARLWVPPGWGPGLLTGQRSHRDLAFDARVAQNSQLDERGWQALEELFPGGHPMWSYSPVFDLADE